jgi:hypothetical protein
VLLPEIRDWLNYGISKESDYFAAAIMCFHSTTFLHPYKGIHPKYRSVEERVMHHLSVLSGDKNITIPGFYTPITGPVESQYFDVFQRDKRYLININGTKTISLPRPPTSVIDSKLISSKVIERNVTDFSASGKLLYVNGAIYDVSRHAVVRKIASGRVGKGYCVGNTVVIVDKLKQMYVFNNGVLHGITNFRVGDNTLFMHSDLALTAFDPQSDSANVFVPEYTSGERIYSTKQTIYVDSLQVKETCAIQSIAGTKAIISAIPEGLITIRAALNILDARLHKGFLTLTIKDKGIVKHYLAKQDGLKIDLGPEITSMKSFAIVGDNLFLPADRELHVYSTKGLGLLAQIQCDLVEEHSILRSCGAGILCQTDTSLYLLNKA